MLGGSHGWNEDHLYIFQGQGWGGTNQRSRFNLEISTVHNEEIGEEVEGGGTCHAGEKSVKAFSPNTQKEACDKDRRDKWQRCHVSSREVA